MPGVLPPQFLRELCLFSHLGKELSEKVLPPLRVPVQNPVSMPEKVAFSRLLRLDPRVYSQLGCVAFSQTVRGDLGCTV